MALFIADEIIAALARADPPPFPSPPLKEPSERAIPYLLRKTRFNSRAKKDQDKAYEAAQNAAIRELIMQNWLNLASTPAYQEPQTSSTQKAGDEDVEAAGAAAQPVDLPLRLW